MVVITALDMFAAQYGFRDLNKAQETYTALSQQSKHYYEGEAAHLNAVLEIKQQREQENGQREQDGKHTDGATG